MLRPLFILLVLSTAARAQITPQTPGWFPFPISVMEQAESPWGTAPALVLGLELTLKLPADSKWTVTPLSHTGAAREPLKDASRITPEAKTPWFLLTRE
jgi:hypothetical protein